MSNNTRDTSSTSQDDLSKYKMIEGKYTVQQCMDTAERIVREKTSCYKLLDLDAENIIPKLHTDELTLGRALGKGAFCVVREVTNIMLKNKTSDDVQQKDAQKQVYSDERMILSVIQDRKFMETHCQRGSQRDCRYAIKAVQSSCASDAQRYINGVVDLAVEARFLSVIFHPNIIKMRAMSSESPFSATRPFFLILDRLYDILGTRIAQWKRQKTGNMSVLNCRTSMKAQELWMERISVVLDLATALKYLHDSNIVYRDIKPDNIGFDVRGDVKIFDFGLSKELDPTTKDADGFYNMTADTGSPRYMAPEVFLGERYNESVDVYSFSILMWQILKLQTPHEGYTMSMLTKKVIHGGGRPKCDPKWSPQLRDLMQKGWGVPKNRPTMDEVTEVLRCEINCYTMDKRFGGNELDASRKSDASLLQFK